MSNVAKLKKKAAELEQKKQFDKALAVYVQALEQLDPKEAEADVALYNRVGDLLLRQGNVGEAVNYYEKAVDLYSDGGFFNNAIALCNKILRNSPGRASIYYKLGRISARKGFTSDAKQNFLEYADRMQRAGQIDEAFRALKEFADLCPDQDDIRLMLAEQLTKRDRKGEALQQLQQLYDKFEAEGRAAEARATVDRMKAIDPTVEPKAGNVAIKQKSSDLVFLDVDWEEPESRRDAPPARGGAPQRPGRAAPAEDELEPLDVESTSLADESTGRADDISLDVETFEPRGTEAPDDYDDSVPDPDVETFEPPVERGAGGRAAMPEDPDSGFEISMPQSDDFGQEPLVEEEPLANFDASAGDDLGITRGGGFDGGTFEPEPMAGFESGFGGGETGSWGGGAEQESGSDSWRRAEHDLALPGDLPSIPRADGEESGGGLDLILPDDDFRFGSDAFDDELPAISRPEGASREGGYDLGAQDEDVNFIALDGADSLVHGSEQEEAEEEPPAPPARAPGSRARRPVADSGEGQWGGAGTKRWAEPADELQEAAAAVQSSPDDGVKRRRLAELLLDRGRREEGIAELELAMSAFERAGDLDSAESVTDEIIRLEPNSVRHHQKRVEYAFRTSDKPRLIEAYLELADSLFRSGHSDKARSVYHRVIELAPDDARAVAALSAFADPEPAPAAPPAKKERKEQSGLHRRYTAEREPELEKTPEPEPASVDTGDFVNLGDWLRDDEPQRSTRMVVEERAPTGDEAADFSDMLRRFKQGLAQNVEDEDHESHYDLGVAFKEMGLLDEAVAEFQKALRGTDRRVRTYEALGQCFLEQSQFQVAATILSRALDEPGHADDELVGVLYLLGYACEALQRWSDSIGYYQRVFAVDVQFRDVGDRLAALQRVAR